MHAQAQYPKLVRRDYGGTDGMIGADGWRYGTPEEGCFDSSALAVAAKVLAQHTPTPSAGVAAIWSGFGGMLSSAGATQLMMEPVLGMPARYTAMAVTVQKRF